MEDSKKANVDPYEDEKSKLKISQKKEIIEKLNTISKKIKYDKSIKDFLKNASYEDYNPIVPEINSLKNKILIWINVKIVTIFFISLYLTGIFVLIGLTDSVMSEIKFSANLYLFNKTRLKNETFFDNYNSINHQTPTFSLYFFSSVLSTPLFSCTGIYFLTIIILLLNASCLFFGLANFEFHISLNDYNNNYSFKQFLFLLAIYFLLSVFVGIISPLPLNILRSAFFQYEKWIEAYNNNKLEKKNTIKTEDDSPKDEIININNQDISICKIDSLSITDFDENDFKPKDRKYGGNYNLYFFGYFLSILISMFLKIIINKYYIWPKYNNENNLLFFIAIIIFHISPILLSLFFYCIFSIIFNSKIKKNKKNKIISSCRLFGYIYYSEKETNPKNITCEECRTGIRKCYYNCYCYKCPCFKCCECNICCQCFHCSHIECCSKKEDLSQINNRAKQIYIIFRTSGIFSWFCNLLTNRIVYGFSFIMIFLELINFGFRPSLATFLKNCDNSKKDIINIFLLLGIFLFYLLSIISGCIFTKCFREEFKKPLSEGSYLGAGIAFLIVTGSIISFIVSLLIYFEIISDNKKYFFIPFSIGSIEYYKILLKRMSKELLELEVISFDTVFSIYIRIWNTFVYILEIINISYSNLILTQFIITSIVILFSLCFSICCYKLKKENNKIKKLEQLIEEKKKENEEKLNKTNDLKEKLESYQRISDDNDSPSNLLLDK